MMCLLTNGGEYNQSYVVLQNMESLGNKLWTKFTRLVMM